MAALKEFTITRQSGETWEYRIEIVDDQGSSIRFSASFDELDKIALAIDEQMAAIVDAAEKMAGTDQ